MHLAHAGPCDRQIKDMQSRIDDLLWTAAANGPSAAETQGALTHRQPTQQSVEAAEQALGDVSAETVERLRQGMSQARAADAAGDEKACGAALAEVKQAYDAEAARRGKP
jgi:peptidoglycan hydrolase CwlO-like protein